MTALRLARAATGRTHVLKFAGAYHGHVDGLLAQAGSGLATQAIPSSPGVLASTTAETVIVPWNDTDALVAATEAHELAAIIAEPLPANMGLVPPQDGFLRLLRAQADATGALLIFDEVISGFRVARGGAQELSGVLPDLVVMGKVIGGGLPAGGVGGPHSLMELLAPAGDVYQAGTLSGNPLAVAAALATLHHLDERAYSRLAAITAQLADGLREAAGDRPVTIASVPGLLTVFFAARPVRNLADAQACDLDGYGAWCRALLARGVYPPPSQFEAWFPSLAHTAEHIELTIAAARAAAFARERSSADLGEAGGSSAPRERADADARGPAARRGRPRRRGRRRPRLGRCDRARPRSWPTARARARAPRPTRSCVEAVYEGYLLHYGGARVVRTEDADLALLAGDQLYALGLARLVALGDLDGVRELADVISLAALAQASGDAALAAAVWRAGVRAIAWGAGPEHERAKELVRRGAPGAAAALAAA